MGVWNLMPRGLFSSSWSFMPNSIESLPNLDALITWLGSLRWSQNLNQSDEIMSDAAIKLLLRLSIWKMNAPSKWQYSSTNLLKAATSFSESPSLTCERKYLPIDVRLYCGNMVFIHVIKLNTVTQVKNNSQNHNTIKNFSFNKLIGSAHWTLCWCILSPRFRILKSQNVTLGSKWIKN